jgi:hypothetical protein
MEKGNLWKDVWGRNISMMCYCCTYLKRKDIIVPCFKMVVALEIEIADQDKVVKKAWLRDRYEHLPSVDAECHGETWGRTKTGYIKIHTHWKIKMVDVWEVKKCNGYIPSVSG